MFIIKALATLYILYLFLNLIIALRIAIALLRIGNKGGNSANNRKYMLKIYKIGIKLLGPIKSLIALKIISKIKSSFSLPRNSLKKI